MNESVVLTATAGGVWTQAFTVPAGTYDYLIALNGSYDETYGECCAPGGPQITITVPTAIPVRRAPGTSPRARPVSPRG